MPDDSRLIGRCQSCEGPVYDADEYVRDDAGRLFCPWCAPDPDPTPLEDSDVR